MVLLNTVIAGESGGKAMSRIYGNIGFKGLWNGLPVRIAMIGTLVWSLSTKHEDIVKRLTFI